MEIEQITEKFARRIIWLDKYKRWTTWQEDVIKFFTQIWNDPNLAKSKAEWERITNRFGNLAENFDILFVAIEESDVDYDFIRLGKNGVVLVNKIKNKSLNWHSAGDELTTRDLSWENGSYVVQPINTNRVQPFNSTYDKEDTENSSEDDYESTREEFESVEVDKEIEWNRFCYANRLGDSTMRNKSLKDKYIKNIEATSSETKAILDELGIHTPMRTVKAPSTKNNTTPNFANSKKSEVTPNPNSYLSKATPQTSKTEVESIDSRMSKLEALMENITQLIAKPSSILKDDEKKVNSKKKKSAVSFSTFSTTEASETSDTSDSSSSEESEGSDRTKKERKTTKRYKNVPYLSAAPSINSLSSKEDDAIRWFSKFEKIAKAYRWDDKQMASQVATFFDGEAEEIYDGLEDSVKKKYSKVREQMLKRLKKSGAELSVMKQYLTLKQEEGETASQLGNRLKRLIERSKRLKSQETESNSAKQYINALDPSVASALINHKWKSLDEVIKAAERSENIWKNNAPTQNFGVNSIYNQKGQDNQHSGDPPKNNLVNTRCFNCGKLGHIAAKCTEKKEGTQQCDFCGKRGHNEADCFSKKTFEKRKTGLTRSSEQAKGSTLKTEAQGSDQMPLTH